MTLKTDFFDGATGLHTQMNDVFDQGAAFVTANLASLTSEMTTAAASGIINFTVSIESTFEPAALRLEGLHLQHYIAGIVAQLAIEDIYSHEVVISLNTSNTTTTSIDFAFSF